MRSEAENKKWGTIYLGTGKEATLDSLDAMQASVQHEQWNQRTQNDYLDRVRERAAERAREILGAAHTERQNILQEARAEAERIRLEAQVQYAKADEALAQAAATRNAAEAQHTEAEAIHSAAQQEGFDQGLANAHDELNAFRGAMGASVAVVLQAIERQNGALFAAWREEMVELVKTCVEKGTEWVLTSHYADVLRALVMESVRKLDNRHTVTLRVHPDDEAAVADMFAAARDAMPDVERWIVNGDPDIELGGLVAESFSSTVDNRVELRRTLVDNVLQHLTLPEGEADVIAASLVHEVVQEQLAHIAEIAPPLPEDFHNEAAPAPETALEVEASPGAESEAYSSDAPESPENFTNAVDLDEGVTEADDNLVHAAPDISALEDMAAALRAAEAHAPEFAPALPEDLAAESADPFLADSETDAAEIEAEDTMRAEHAAPSSAESLPRSDATPPAYAAEPAYAADPAYIAEPTYQADPADQAEPMQAHLSSLEELERELLPLPEEQFGQEEQHSQHFVEENSADMDEVLISGGFISEPTPTRGAESAS